VDPATGAVRVEVDIPNPGGKVLPGMTGEARVGAGKAPADALRVPIAALRPVAPRRADRMTHRVYVVRGGVARLTPVRVAYADGTEAEVAAGLTADDLVVADPRGLQGDDVPVRVAPSAPQ
jgi:multidrug efflux pump subunit AcrA (membrane-fusion protein)